MIYWPLSQTKEDAILKALAVIDFCLLITLLASSMAVFAAPAGFLEFKDAWSRATVPGARTAAIYGTLVNTGETAFKVVSVQTDIAKMAQVHQSVMEGDMMRMKHIGELTVGPGEQVEFSPGSLHIMLMGLARPLQEGESFDVILRTADGKTLLVPVIVGTIGEMTFPQAHSEHH